jgi:sugar phosphate isomerase/epimerase
VNGLAPVRELIASADRPNLGLLLDAYHLQRGGEGGASFADIAPEEIFAFQFSDVPPEGSGPATLTDRLLPGKGIVRWIDVFRLLNVKNFGGFLSFEGPHPDTWARPPLDVCREAVAAIRALIAQALTPAG